MEHEFNQIKKVLTNLHELQANHIASFNTDAIPDIEQQSADREKGFHLFKKQITDFIHMAEIREDDKTESMLHFCNTSIATLLEQNKTLEIKVSTIRDSIRHNIRQLSNGRQAIGRYGSPGKKSNHPKVISITN